MRWLELQLREAREAATAARDSAASDGKAAQEAVVEARREAEQQRSTAEGLRRRAEQAELAAAEQLGSGKRAAEEGTAEQRRLASRVAPRLVITASAGLYPLAWRPA